MKLIAVLRLGPNVQLAAEVLDAQLRATWRLHKHAAVRSIEELADAPGAVITMECADLAAAFALIEPLPLVQAGLVSMDLLPLRPYVGWERLF